jgi:hypothetical protein
LFPRFGNIACLMDDPALWRTLWLSRLQSYVSSVEMRVRELQSEADGDELLPRTRRRLLRIGAALTAQVEAIHALFEPIAAGGPDQLPTVAIPSRPESGSPAGILECYENLFRDWVWGQRECELQLELLAPVVPSRLARIAVYGAGAGRLAVDLHRAAAPAETVALDVNPLPFLVADRILAGETVTLPELPVDPNSEGEVAIARTFERPFVVGEGFSFVFADALRPPFAAGSLDAVITSWFIDVARSDLRQTAAAVNRVLRQGGLWVNLGPLRFHQTASRSYTIEEVLDIVGQGAFEVVSQDRHDLPYFDSPVSGSRRTETVFRFVARKTGEVRAVEIPDPVPPWVANPLMPIPITPALIALGRTSMFTSAVLSMIDGTRSIVDLSRGLGSAWGVDPGRLHDELRAFLARLPGS